MFRSRFAWLVALVVGSICEPALHKMHPVEIDIFINQMESAELPLDVEHAESLSVRCRFVAKRPSFTKVYEMLVGVEGRASPEQRLMNRLRTAEDSLAEHLLILPNYIFVLHNTREVMILMEDANATGISKTFNYLIKELPANAQPFAFNDEVIFVTENLVIRCDSSGYHVTKKTINDSGEGLQLTNTTFALITTTSLELYRWNAHLSEFVRERAFTSADLTKLYPDSEKPWWVRCRLYNQHQLMCLDNRNGLFEFDEELQHPKLLTSRSNCFDFMLTEYRDRIFQCLLHGELFEFSDLEAVKTHDIQFSVHDMFQLKNWRTHYAKVGRSRLALMNRNHPEYSTEINFSGTISKLVEKSLPGVTNETYFYVLLSNRLEKYRVKMNPPHIACVSAEPVIETVQFTVTTEGNEKSLLNIYLRIKPQPIDHTTALSSLLLCMLALAVCAAILFLGVICFYQRQERYLRQIYSTIKQRTEDRTKKLASV